MGKGIAQVYKLRYPLMFNEYEALSEPINKTWVTLVIQQAR